VGFEGHFGGVVRMVCVCVCVRGLVGVENSGVFEAQISRYWMLICSRADTVLRRFCKEDLMYWVLRNGKF
jgi:hypothetical protein